MNMKSPFDSYLFALSLKILMIISAFITVTSSVRQGALSGGAVYFLAIALIAHFISGFLCWKYHALKIKDEYGTEYEIESIDKKIKLISLIELAMLVTSIVMALFGV